MKRYQYPFFFCFYLEGIPNNNQEGFEEIRVVIFSFVCFSCFFSLILISKRYLVSYAQLVSLAEHTKEKIITLILSKKRYQYPMRSLYPLLSILLFSLRRKDTSILCAAKLRILLAKPSFALKSSILKS